MILYEAIIKLHISYLRQLIPYERRRDHLVVKVRLMLLLLSLPDPS